MNKEITGLISKLIELSKSADFSGFLRDTIQEVQPHTGVMGSFHEYINSSIDLTATANWPIGKGDLDDKFTIFHEGLGIPIIFYLFRRIVSSHAEPRELAIGIDFKGLRSASGIGIPRQMFHHRAYIGSTDIRVESYGSTPGNLFDIFISRHYYVDKGHVHETDCRFSTNYPDFPIKIHDSDIYLLNYEGIDSVRGYDHTKTYVLDRVVNDIAQYTILGASASADEIQRFLLANKVKVEYLLTPTVRPPYTLIIPTISAI